MLGTTLVAQEHGAAPMGGGGGGTPWDPSLLGPALWVDSLDAISAPAVGAVSTWTDISGHTRNLTQATTGNKPVQTASILNGHNAVRFDSDDFLATAASLAQAQPYTIVVVAAVTSLSASFTSLFDLGTPPTTPGPQATIDQSLGSDWVYYAGNEADTGALADTTAHCYVVIYDGTVSEFWIDGVRQGGNIDAGTLAAAYFRLGGTFDGAAASVDVGMALFVPGNVGATGVAEVTGYAHTRFGTADLTPTGSGAPVIDAFAPGGGTQGNVYAGYTFHATGDVPISWTATGLPPGLTLANTTGVLSGTPTTAGTYTPTITATNAAGVDHKTPTIVIGASSPTAPTVTTSSLPGGTVGSAYSTTLHATGTAPITWSSVGTALPSGLTLNTSTGVISGTPTGAATTSGIILRATNSVGHGDSPSMSLTVIASGGRQAFGTWLGIVDMDNLVGNNAGGFTLASLQNVGLGFDVITGVPGSSPYPSWLISELRSCVSNGRTTFGGYLANAIFPLPSPNNSSQRSDFQTRWQYIVDAAVAAGCYSVNSDAEPYGYTGGGDNPSDNPWCTNGPLSMTRTWAHTLGGDLGSRAVAGGMHYLLCYNSSNAGFPGSYNDALRSANGNPNTYDNNCYADFLKGVMDAGLPVVFMDGSFEWGPQLAADGGNWMTGVTHTRTLTESASVFSGYTVLVSVLPWPDNDEGHGFYSTGESQAAVDAATRNGSGPGSLYQHQLATRTQVSFWSSTLSAIDALGL